MSKFGDFLWTKRTQLERGLMIALALCVLMLSTDAIVLLSKLPWDWGSAADWFTGVVTLFGFVGAFFALRLQTSSLRIQKEQHQKDVDKDAAAEQEIVEQEAAAAQETKWRCAKGTSLVITTQRGDPRNNYVYKQKLQIRCEVRAPQGANLKNVNLSTPSLGSFFKEIHPSDRNLETLTPARPMRWTMETDYWPAEFGEEVDATKWLQDRVSVTFTDPNGVTWTRTGSGGLTDMAPLGEAP
ncbi:hypothetical protein [Arthrobacter sp. ZBG10]|uniref:hypothetical protein n=1 Tax=Arthrobacter sp. ZBG10 TaxID=1676590 RepID=UPI0012F8F18F|nr:hypothetical protein [Arthrobacter sp. ZBG10]